MIESVALGKSLYLKLYFDLIRYVKSMELSHFRGVFIRSSLPLIGPRKFESAIIYLDNKDALGTHWVAYKKVEFLILNLIQTCMLVKINFM